MSWYLCLKGKNGSQYALKLGSKKECEDLYEGMIKEEKYKKIIVDHVVKQRDETKYKGEWII